jgi:hypothetical protein
MDNQKKWIMIRIRIGWLFLVAGVLVGFVGVIAELQLGHLFKDFRIVTGLGILLVGIGAGYLVRYGSALKDEKSALRLTVEERDERSVLIRARAGNRAFWVSTVLINIGLMWSSFASNDRLPPLTGDTLWFYLAAAVLLPFGVYITSILVDERNL